MKLMQCELTCVGARYLATKLQNNTDIKLDNSKIGTMTSGEPDSPLRKLLIEVGLEINESFVFKPNESFDETNLYGIAPITQDTLL